MNLIQAKKNWKKKQTIFCIFLLSFDVKNVFGKYWRTFATNVNAIDRFDNSILWR
jgi:hypothetical protein